MAKGDSLFAIFYDGEPIKSEFIKHHMDSVYYTPPKKVYFYKAQAENAVGKLPETIDRTKIEVVEYTPTSSKVKFCADGTPLS